MTGASKETTVYEVNGHELEVVEDYGDAQILECRECLIREVLDDEDDPEDYLDLMTPECHIEWLRKPDGGFHGVALRNAACFRGRELIGVDSDGEVSDNVRVYDDDVPLLQSLLDRHDWEMRENR